MKKLLQSLFVLLLLATVAVAQERAIRSNIMANEGHKHPPDTNIPIKTADDRTTTDAAFKLELI